MTILARSSTRTAPSRPGPPPPAPTTPSARPMVRTPRSALRHWPFLPPSQPREPLPTVAAPGTLWESTAPAEAIGSRPAQRNGRGQPDAGACLPPSLQRVLDTQELSPGYAINGRFDIIRWNQAALAVFGDFS